MSSNFWLIIATTLGTILEWAEFVCYGYLASKISKLFFDVHQKYALILTFAVFAVSYLARPIGAVILGYVGDSYGRRVALFTSIIGMGIATLGIAVTPTYQEIGVLATIILIGCRLIQGISIAGEFTGAAIFIAEHNHKENKNLAISWVSCSSALGMALGAALASIVSIANMPEWSWRIPFFIGFIGCLTGLLLRGLVQESPEFYNKIVINNNNSFKQFRQGLLHTMWSLRVSLLKSFLIASFIGVYILICNLWWTSYVFQQHYFSEHDAHLLSFLGVMMAVVLTPTAAYIVDRCKIVPRKIMKIGLLLSVLSAPLMFWIPMQFPGFWFGFIVQLIYALNNVLVASVMFTYLSELFPVQIRYFALGISWNLAVAVFGGTAPLVAQLLLTNTNSVLYIAGYVALFGASAGLII